MSIRPLDKQKCPLNIQMSIRPVDQQKCPLDIQMSIRPMDEQKCPLDIQMSIRPMDEWTNGHCLMASTLVSYPHGVRRMLNMTVSYPQGVMLDRITSLQQFWHCKSKMSIGRTEMSIEHKYMSIRPLDEQKCPLDIQMSIRPLEEWTLSNSKHSSLLSTWGQT